MATDALPPRRNPFDTGSIHALVHAFYDRVRADEVLGPVFAARIDDWPWHLDRMVLFWRSVLRGEGVYTPHARGGPPLLHRAITELEHAHFDRWLALFEQTAARVFPKDAADAVVMRAGQIGTVLASHLPPRA